MKVLNTFEEAQILTVSPFTQFGTPIEIIRTFGGPDSYLRAVREKLESKDMPIGSLIKNIQDIMRKDVGVDGDSQRISQLIWLLFLKIFDDKEQEWQFKVPGYQSPLQSRFRWSNWAKDEEGITGEELIDFVNNNLFPALKQLATKTGVSARGQVIGAMFEDAYHYMKSGTLLRQVINTSVVIAGFL